jgi:hypothetical protein
MDKSYLDTSKIAVELAVSKGYAGAHRWKAPPSRELTLSSSLNRSEELERPWSKHSKGSSKNPETAQVRGASNL